MVEAHLFSDKTATFEENSVILNCIENRGLQKHTRTLIFKKSRSSKIIEQEDEIKNVLKKSH